MPFAKITIRSMHSISFEWVTYVELDEGHLNDKRQLPSPLSDELLKEAVLACCDNSTIKLVENEGD